jgi:hypothetical protein
MPTQAKCPTCGAPLVFRPGTMVTVCSHCRSLSARTDRDPRLIGKVADLVDTGSAFRVGIDGSYAGRKFALVGRTQMRHPSGGVWDEWYLALEDGRWGWLAEAQGRFYLTFKHAVNVPIPPPESLAVGGTVNLGDQGLWMVSEVSQGTFAAAEGEIPWEVELEGTYPFADLSAPNGAFATLDYSETPPLFFTGREIPFEDLKLPLPPAIPGTGPRLKTQNLPCPSCAAPLSLRAPDQTEHVVCPACGSLLDASGGRLTYLKSLQQPNPRMFIALGTEGHLGGVPLTCIGYLLRSCTVEGTKYPWGEYLLMDSRHGFRWLVESDGHWSVAEAVPLGEIRKRGPAIVYKGESYKAFQSVEAVVEGVYGEFYWKVEQGERVRVSEFVHAPISIAEEVQTQPGGGQEVNWSKSTYLEGAEVWKAFKLQGVPAAPQGIAPHQPNPHWKKAQQLGLWMVAAFALLVLMLGWEAITHRQKLVFQEDYNLLERIPALKDPAATTPPEVVFFSEPFEILDGTKNFSATISAPVNNNWIGVEGAIVSETTGIAEVFEVASNYYSGSDEDGPWTEGNRSQTVYLSSVPPGRYVLRIAPVWDGAQPPVPTFSVELRTGITRWIYGLLTAACIALFPLLAWLRALAFENRRWQESMYSSSGSSSEDE